jgi:hypothetical protein
MKSWGIRGSGRVNEMQGRLESTMLLYYEKNSTQFGERSGGRIITEV